MTTTSHLTDNLTLLADESSLLLQTAEGFDHDSVRAPSLCQGWTRAHVLSHIARNADGLGRLVSWAVTGTPAAMYESPQSREADIVAGSGRTTREIVADLRESVARFASVAPDLAGLPEQTEVELRPGRRVLGGQLPTLRLMEVVFHHVDLDAGYTFAQADPGFVRRAITNAVQRMGTSAEVPGVLLRSDQVPRDQARSDTVRSDEQGGDRWSMGEGTQVVTGTNAALLLWLARGDGSGVSSEHPLPQLPPWG